MRTVKLRFDVCIVLAACLVFATAPVGFAAGSERALPERTPPQPTHSGPELEPGGVDNDGDGFFTPADCNDNDPDIHPGAAEACNGLDDDCDSQADEDFQEPVLGATGLGEPCDNGELGVCNEPGIYVCNGAGTGTQCNAPVGTPNPLGEVCDGGGDPNGLDDDCDGTVDEGVRFVATTGADTSDCTDPGSPCLTIQFGVDQACNGEIVDVAAGTYAELVLIAKPGLTVQGAGIGATNVHVGGLGAANDNAGISVRRDNVTVRELTVDGLSAASPRYGLKVASDAPNPPGTKTDGVVIRNVRAQNVFRSGFDLNAPDNITLDRLEAIDNGGAGIFLLDSIGAAVSNITTSGNTWAGMSIATFGRFAPGGTTGVVFSGTNSFAEVGIPNGGLQLEEGNFNDPGNPIPISWSSCPGDGADVTVQPADFQYVLGGPQCSVQNRLRFYDTLANAQAAAAASGGGSCGAGTIDHFDDVDRFIQDADCFTTSPTNFHVFDDPGDRMSIQAAIDEAVDGDVINVADGSFAGGLDIDEELSILCANAGVPYNGARNPESTIDGSGSPSTINLSSSNVTIDGCDLRGDASTFAGVLMFNNSSPINGVSIVNNRVRGMAGDNPSSVFDQGYGIFGVTGNGPGDRQQISGLTVSGNEVFSIGAPGAVSGHGVYLFNVIGGGAGSGATITGNSFHELESASATQVGTGVTVLEGADDGAGLPVIPSSGVLVQNNLYDNAPVGAVLMADDSSFDELRASFSNTLPGVQYPFIAFLLNLGIDAFAPGPYAAVNEAVLEPYATSDAVTGLVDAHLLYTPTIAGAIAASDPGATIGVAGSFSENSVSVDRGVTIAGSGCASTEIDGGGGANIIFFIESSDVTFRDLTLRNSSQAIRYIPHAGPSTDNTEFDGVCFIDHSSRAIEVHNAVVANDIRVIDSQFDNSNIGGGGAIRMSSSSVVDGLAVTGSSFDTGSLGIYQANDGGTSTLANLHVDDCSFTNYTNTAVFAEEIRDSVVENSQFISNRRGVTIFKEYVNGPDVTNFVVRGNTFTDQVDTALIMWVRQGTASDFTFENNVVNVDASLMTANWAVIDVRVIPGMASTSAVIRGNQVTFSGAFAAGATAAHALKLRGSSNATVRGNTFDGGGVASIGGVPGNSGIFIQSDDATFGPIASGTVIDAVLNTIVDFENGAAIYDAVAAATGGLPAGVDLNVNFNDISNNSSLGFESGAGETADANCNWWGSPLGPGPGPAPRNDTAGPVDTSSFLLANDMGQDVPDGDGFGSCVGTMIAAHPDAVPQGDCAPTDPASNPAAPEVCDGDDNNCDGTIPVAETDVDGDLYVECDPWNDTQGNNAGITAGGDCDETRVDVNPGEPERCDDTLIAGAMVDHNCDGDLATPNANDSDADCVAASGSNTCQTDFCLSADDTCDFTASGNCGVAGNVTYNRVVAGADDFDAAKPVEDALLDVAGDTPDTELSDSNGDYQFVNMAGDVTLTATRADDGDDYAAALSGQDAATIAQFSVGSLSLTPRQLVAGDVSDNGSVTSFDAALVSQKVVNPAFLFPAAVNSGSDWAFFDVPQSFTPIAADALGVDLAGVVYGDTTMSWTQTNKSAVDVESEPIPTTQPLTFDMAPRREAVLLYLASVRPLRDGTVEYVLGLQGADGIRGIDLKVHYAERGITVEGIHPRKLLDGFATVTHDGGRGVAAAAAYGVQPLAGTGEFLSLILRAAGPIDGFPVDLTVEANEGLIPVLFSPELRPPVERPELMRPNDEDGVQDVEFTGQRPVGQ